MAKEKEFDLQDFLADVTHDSKFHRASEAQVLHSNQKVRTPHDFLNLLFGGGTPLGAVVEMYGPPGSGKSTFAYQMMGDFQEQYPQGVSVIADAEGSADPHRLEYMGLHPNRILRFPATYIEDTFDQITGILKKKASNVTARPIPVMIILDSLAALLTQAQVEQGRTNAGGMNEKARLTKHYLAQMLPLIEEQPVLFVILNQVYTDTSGYRPKLISGGGMGLKHDIHLQLEFKLQGTQFTDDSSDVTSTVINITKSKLSPRWNNIPIRIDVTRGGVIDKDWSFYQLLLDRGYVHSKGSWWRYNNEALEPYGELISHVEQLHKPYRAADIQNVTIADPIIFEVFKLIMLDKILDKYKYYQSMYGDYRAEIYNNILLQNWIRGGELPPEATLEDMLKLKAERDEIKAQEEKQKYIDECIANGVDPETGEILADKEADGDNGEEEFVTPSTDVVMTDRVVLAEAGEEREVEPELEDNPEE
ncbi:RecA protein [Bacillus phage vB_BceM-HSE3]|nr:RecA protein [Bacillus phage vB_BceM-HSE3]